MKRSALGIGYQNYFGNIIKLLQPYFGTPILISICIYGLIGLSACQFPKGKALDSPSIIEINSQPPQESVLGAGDLIQLRFVYRKDLNTETNIDFNGNASLPIIGQVSLAGRKISNAEKFLTERYSEFLKYSTDTYTLGAGDVLAIKFLYNSDLNEEALIRPDGNISLHLVGEVKAAGLKPSQLNTFLSRNYAKLLDTPTAPELTVMVRESRPPELTLTVKESASHKIYIGGEVTHPRMIPLRGNLRVLDALILAGGSLNTGQLDQVILLRKNSPQDATAYLLNLKKVLAGEIPDVYLKPSDIVYIAKDPLAQINVITSQIYSLIPRNIFLNLFYDLDRRSTSGGDVTIKPSGSASP